MAYTAKTFSIPSLEGISSRTIEEHLKLYQGYVKHVNLIEEKLADLNLDPEKNAYALSEVQRRLGFEWGGMKNHEAYFVQFEGGAQTLPEGSLKAGIEALWGSFETFMARFTASAMTRGVGWAMLLLDRETHALRIAWIDEQHLGQLPHTDVILALDMWEHSYMLDYPPSEKKKYIEAFFKNLNWHVCEERYRSAH